jgi:16S rRNA (cytosine1402-N4)-methyltransferase
METAEGKCRLHGFDLDPQVLSAADGRLAPYRGTYRLFHANYRDIATLPGVSGNVDGLLLDLGYSSFQMERPERGFGFQAGILDMRYDPELPAGAAEVLERESEEQLQWILRTYGEEEEAGRIARAIVEERWMGGDPWTGPRLAGLVARVKRRRRRRIHPATLVFQALRIFVNQELENLDVLLIGMPGILRVGGKAVVISDHSLEDRRVKNAFREGATRGVYRLLTKKIVRASWEEIRENPRARSACLRAVEKI